MQKSDINIARRKAEHLRIVAEEDVSHRGTTLLEDIRLMHQALPELDLDEIDTRTVFFGKELAAPLMITGMTGGADFARELNHGLASVASHYRIAFAVGSQRVMLRHPEVIGDFAVRESIPDGVLLSNIGAVQLEEYSPEVIAGLVDDIEADGICIHLNAAQEILQEEGHRRFRGLTERIARIVDKLEGRVVVKETGTGMSPETLEKLAGIGVPYIDVSGAGGTSWTKVEMYRASDTLLRRMGKTFADWGIPTAFSVMAARKIVNEKTCVIASGGIISGLDAARAVAAGADMIGFARSVLLPFLDGGTEHASEHVDGIINELRTAMLLTGAVNLKALQKVPRVYTGQLAEWLRTCGWAD